jgi:uncharacterized protein (TIGR03435 family)
MNRHASLNRLALCVGGALVVAASVLAGAQSAPQSSAGATFDAASIKRNVTGRGGLPFPRLQPGRLTTNGITLRALVRAAYGDEGISMMTQVVGGPSWMDSDRFDIVATAPSGSTINMKMLQALLVERFGLASHRETREMPVFDMVLANSDGKLGPQLVKSSCVRPGPDGQAPALPAGAVACAPLRLIPSAAGPTAMAQGVTMSELAGVLSGFPEIARQVRDKTALTGAYDLKISWVGGVRLGPNFEVAGTNPNADSGPGILTALREQLGLRMENTRDQVPVVIVDRAEPPTEN